MLVDAHGHKQVSPIASLVVRRLLELASERLIEEPVIALQGRQDLVAGVK
jgi:hypothetical protein